MYESTINIEIVKDGSQKPLDFLNTTSLWETTTITGTVSGVVSINSTWINNTLSDRVVSTIECAVEAEELIPTWIDILQNKAELEGLTIYISVSGG